MKCTAKLLLWLGIAAHAAALTYAGGATVAFMSATVFLPVAAFAAGLQSRIKRKKVEEKRAVLSSLSVGGCLIASSIIGVCVTKRPGHEADGMFGGLFFIWPLITSTVSCLLVAWHLPATRTTYN
jgi:hypothetical protein